MSLERVVIVGKAGAGKTTLSTKLAEKFDLQNVELDGISWQANWINLPKPQFRERVDATLPSSGRWVADGNYVRSAQDIIWKRADTLIWLDYPLYIALWRVFKRTASRVFKRTELWNGNRESLWHHLNLNRDENLFAWTVRMHWQHRRDFPGMLKREEYQHLNVLRFRYPRETEEWLRSLPDVKDA